MKTPKPNRFSIALDRIRKYVEPQDNWSEEDWEHYKTVCEALEMASEKEERI
jgi:hypothetical protein